MSTLTYKDSGVDVQKGEELVSRIKKKVRSTYGERVYDGVGGFASLYKITDEKIRIGDIASHHINFGVNALFFNNSGNANNAMGFKALYFNTTGKSNIANGYL